VLNESPTAHEFGCGPPDFNRAAQWGQSAASLVTLSPHRQQVDSPASSTTGSESKKKVSSIGCQGFGSTLDGNDHR
jgi:hypothetical protein